SGEVVTVIAQLEKGMGRNITADDIEIETWMLKEAGKSVSAADFSASLASWDIAAAQMAKLHETYDFYITPATAFPAPNIGELTYSENEEKTYREQIGTLSANAQQELIYDMFLPSLTYTPFSQ